MLNIFKSKKRKQLEEENRRAEEERKIADAAVALVAAREKAEQDKKDQAERKRLEDKAKAEAIKETKDAAMSKEKEAATLAGEPYIEIISFDLDIDNLGEGAFELDWNDIFVARLIKGGFQGNTDHDIVDNWFNTVCNGVAMETWEQEQADPEKRESNRKDLGDGRIEVS